MKYTIFLLSILLVLNSCSDDEKAIEFLFKNVKRGAVLRNIDRVSSDFVHNDFNSKFELVGEIQGTQFDYMRLHLKYIDRSANGTGIETREVILADVPSEDFVYGPLQLLRTTIILTYQEAIDKLGLDSNQISPGDQFELRVELFLTDGRGLSNSSGSGTILSDHCFFKSPFRYVINVIEPVQNNLFIGSYSYKILSDNPPEDIPEEGFVNIRNGDLDNQRVIPIGIEGIPYTIAGPFLYPKIYAVHNDFAGCRDSQFIILSGPREDTFGSYDLMNDAVFELDYVVGYEGWDAELGENIRPVRYRFTKQ